MKSLILAILFVINTTVTFADTTDAENAIEVQKAKIADVQEEISEVLDEISTWKIVRNTSVGIVISGALLSALGVKGGAFKPLAAENARSVMDDLSRFGTNVKKVFTLSAMATTVSAGVATIATQSQLNRLRDVLEEKQAELTEMQITLGEY